MIRTARVRKKIVRGVCRVCGCKDCPWGMPSLRLQRLSVGYTESAVARIGARAKKDADGQTTEKGLCARGATMNESVVKLVQLG